jgi:hypothetical protein
MLDQNPATGGISRPDLDLVLDLDVDLDLDIFPFAGSSSALRQ